MVTSRLVEQNDIAPIVSDGGKIIEAVEEFLYLGSLITSSGRMDMDVDRWIALASVVFWCNPQSCVLR